ncbi:MAG: hypothetical protein Q7T51_02675 [Candidatus Moranbacteria bacterium]|nr:hypothetical protein [Candidatus Moranbacteria bacterium]
MLDLTRIKADGVVMDGDMNIAAVKIVARIIKNIAMSIIVAVAVEA